MYFLWDVSIQDSVTAASFGGGEEHLEEEGANKPVHAHGVMEL